MPTGAETESVVATVTTLPQRTAISTVEPDWVMVLDGWTPAACNPATPVAVVGAAGTQLRVRWMPQLSEEDFNAAAVWMDMLADLPPDPDVAWAWIRDAVKHAPTIDARAVTVDAQRATLSGVLDDTIEEILCAPWLADHADRHAGFLTAVGA